MAKSIFVLAGVLLAFSLSATQADHENLFCDYGLYTCPSVYDPSNITCISYTRVCDGVIDCCDGVDESFCGNCTAGYIQCPSTDTCISNTRACDGSMDCLDGADETVNACGCQEEGYVPACRDSNGTAYCINETLLCDGYRDCVNGEDELFPYCPEVCPDEQLSCFGNGSYCFEVYQLCNGVFECPNAYDEGNCTTPEPDSFFCPYGLYFCPDEYGGRSCLNYTRVCDGINDCYNGTDEALCGDCPPGYILCPNTSTCIENSRACDSVPDCPDGCDEGVGACGCFDENQVPVCRYTNGDPYCINENLICDGNRDCMYGEDEQFPYCSGMMCGPEEVTCYETNSCVKITDVCSGYTMCPSLYRQFCDNTPQFCPYGTYNCARQDSCLLDTCCLNYTNVCDGTYDCLSGSDECDDICGNCSVGMVQCPGTDICVSNTVVCDGSWNCPNGTDESVRTCGCQDESEVPVCTDSYGEPYCLSSSRICDGVPDCLYGEDESEIYGCTATTPPPPEFCPYKTFDCRSGSCNDSCCLNYTNVCDGEVECLSGRDEDYDVCGNCPPNKLQCHNSSVCVSNMQICDGYVDCPDGFDESVRACGCSDPYELPVCMNSNGDLYCLNFSRVCDGVPDCIYGEDESEIYGCATPSPPPSPYFCPIGYFPCSTSETSDEQTCIPQSYLCDNVTHCSNGIDEEICTGCPPGQALCPDGSGVCIELSGVCNTVRDCPSGIDESIFFCGTSTGGPPPGYFCPVNEILCQGEFGLPTCVPNSYFCNGVDECLNGTDEAVCFGCPPNQLLCPGTLMCINNTDLCDTVYDCPSGFDELICGPSVPTPTIDPTASPYICPINYFPCINEYGIPTCVPNYYLCDGVSQCYNGTDELLCQNCPPGQVICPDSSLACINNTDVCDTVYDCPGGFDELICGAGTTPTPQPGCPPGGYPCGFDPSRCWTLEQACNGFNDCGDELAFDEIGGFVEMFGASCAVNSSVRGEELVIGLNAPPFGGVLAFSEGTNTPFCILRGGFSSLDQFNVTFSYYPGYSAVPGEDFVDFSGPENKLIFGPDDTIACTNISIIDDDIVEDMEMFNFTLNIEANVPYTFIGPQRTDIQIFDNDGAVVRVLNNSISVSEAGPTDMEVCVVLEDIKGGLDKEVVFEVIAGGGGSAINGVDFMLLNTRLIFSQDSVPGAKECVTFGTVIDDDEIEFNESYYFYVQPTGVADTFANGTSNSIYVTITNDDFFEFAFVNNTMVEVVEGDTISICVAPLSNVSQVLDGSFYLSLQFELSGNATSSEYYAYDRYHTFSMLSDFDDICVIIETREDFVMEPNVNFTVRVVFNNGFGALTGPQEVAVTILDDDEAPEFEFINPPQEMITEGGQLMVCLNPITNLTERLGYGSGSVFHLEFNATGRTATNDDFAFTSAAHYLSAASNFDNICVVVDILDDDYIEGTEELVVTVHFADPAVLVGHQEVVVEIMDNDVGEFVTAGFMDRTEREGEWDLLTESIRYCVSPTQNTSMSLRTNVYFVFTIEDGTAVEGQDFEILRQDQVYNYTSMGDSVCAEVRILNDNFIEGTEYFSVSVNTASGSPIRLVGNTMSSVTIMDNDTIQVSLEIRDEGGYVREDSGYFSVGVVLVDDLDGLDKDVNVTFMILDDSQAKRRKRLVAPPMQGDVSPTGSQTLTILAGTTVNESVYLNVTVNDDNIIESNETVTIHLDLSDEYSVVDNMYGTVVIVDNDGASLFLSTNEIFLQESVGEVSLMVFVGNMSPRDRDVIVDVSIQLDTADSGDIGEYTQQLTFGPAINELEVTVPIIVDNIVGDDEVFTINFTPVNALDNFINGSQVMVTIDESAELSLTSRSFTGMEGGVAMICVQHANHTLERDVSVELTFMDGTAVSKEDFDVPGATESSVVTLVFRAGEDVTRRCVDVSLLDDDIAEITEMFYVTMRAVDSSDTVGINMSTVSILDNDGVTFVPKDVEVMETDEDQTVSLCVTMTPPAGGLDRNAVISYMSQELIFTRTPTVIAQTGCFNVSVAGDNLVENTETLRLMFTTEYELDARNSTLTATVTVFDDDGATVSFAQPNQTVSEDAGSVMVCVELTDMEGGLRRPVPFTITSDRGMDFEFEFTPDSTVDVCLTVNITDDTIVEYTAERTFTLKVANDNDALGLVTAHTIFVTDNDGAVIEVAPIADVTETDNDQTVSLSFFVNRESGLVERNVVLTVSLIGDTTDVVLTTRTVTLEPGLPTYELGILTVIGDNIVEADEEFRVMITADNTLDSVVGSPLNFTVFDDDGAVVSFSTPGQTVAEDVGIVMVCAELTDIEDGLDRPVPFTFTTDRESMTSYEFPATASVGSTRCLNVNIPDDSLVEETVEMIYTLGVVNSNDMVENDTYTITVEDNDGAVVSFEGPRQTVSEDGGRAMVCVILTDVGGGLNRPVSFTITEDQTSSSHEFSMDAEGGDRICVNITIEDDTVIGDSIERTLTLSVVNGNDGVGELSVHVITVTDDDGATIMFAMREQTVSENVGSVEVCALLVNVQGGLRRAAPFIITSDRGMNFSFQFEAGAAADSRECLTVNITDNLLVGNDLERPFTLAVVDSNDILGMITTHTITVTDNDGATIMFAMTGQTVSEDAGSVMVCVELVDIQDGLERAVPFTITSDRGMTFNFEFEETDSVGSTECMTVSITDDTLVEDTLMRPFTLAVVNEVDILGEVTTHTITVIDNDGVEVTLETSEVTLLEGDETLNSGSVCVSITSNTSLLQRAVQVDATVVSRTDNVPESSFTYDSMVIITPENAGGRVCFTVTILDNTDYTDVIGRVVMSFSLTNANDVFVSDIIMVTIIIEDDDSPLIEEVNYIPFVILEEPDGARLREAAPSDDGCSAQIFMNSGLPYGSIVATSLRVCTNGIISIGTGHFEFFGPELFPSENNLISSSNVLAPYWNDHDARDSSSRIIYKVYTDDLGEAATNKTRSVSALVSTKHNVSFSGVWMLVAEWNRVPAYPAIANTDVNTYQAIVITDGVTTYAVYTYVCGQLEWTSSPGSDVHSVIGFNINNDDASGFNSPFFNHPLSTYPEISSVACTNRELRIEYSNLVYLVGNNEGADQLARADCIKRANLDRSLSRESNPLFDYEAPCPCSSFQARRDSRYGYASFLLAFITRDSSFFSRDCYLQRFQPFFQNSGVQLCCYSRRFFDFGALLDSSFGIEGSSFLRYHPAFYPNQYLEFDYQFKQSCCVDAGICEEYTTLRPLDQCFFYRPQRRAWCWGDPHITTLDGGVFTFNGRGEYILTEFDTSSTGFVLQGRTSPVNATAANITTAIDNAPTQLVAFAFAMNRALPVQIEVKNEADLVVLVNSTDVTGNVTNVNDTYSTNSLSIVRDGEKSLTTSFPNGVGVTVTASFGMLSFVLIIPEEFRNLTRGMMGNYNGDPMDDVRYQNGTMLPHNVSDRTIHEVGQSWEIEPEDSLFTYPEGLSAANFSFPDHMPLFLDEILDEIPQDIKDACGDSEECIYDYYLTQNKEIGMETLNTNMVNTDDQNQASNNPPRIMGPNVLRVDLGMTATLVFNVSDDKNMFNVSILGGLPVNSTLTPTVMDGFTIYTFTWELYEIVSNTLEFEARDELQATAVLNVQVQICACRNNGTCTIDGIIGTSDPNILLNCECSEAWTGRYCEMDVDGCTEFMCFQGVVCNDVPAPGVGAMCGPCPEGYMGDGQKCEDVNECNGTHGCSDICYNFEGGFECRCNSGYELLNTTHCRDIDECAMLNGRCHQICNNEDGSFSCSCYPGYNLTSDGLTCQVLPESECPMNNTCTQECVLLNAVEQCSCFPGYELNADNKTCADVDECLQTPCGQVCTNTEASFECSCNDGYRIQSDNITCLDINECVEAAINENSLCPESMMCVNLQGSEGKFECVCPPGTDTAGDMCVVPTTPPPTTPTTTPTEPLTTPVPPPTGTVPPQFVDDAVIVTITGLTVESFTSDLRLRFRQAFANAINDYCSENQCSPSRKRQAPRNVTADDVIMNNVRNNANGDLAFDVYVLTDGNVAFPASLVETAIEENEADFRPLGFTVMVEPLAGTMPPVPVDTLTTEQIIGIAVGCVLAALLLLVVLVVIIVCCVRRQTRRKSYDFSYGLNYDNPVADADDDIQHVNITVKTNNEEEETPKQKAEPNIYVASGDLDDLTEENPAAIEDAAAEEKGSDRSMQSLILKFGENDDDQHSVEKEEFTSL